MQAAYGELKKSLEILRGLEEVEPPAWMAQKVMARIRAEQAPKENFLIRLLRRFPTGIPVTAAASLVIAVAALLVMKEMEPKVRDAVPPGISGRVQEAPSEKGVEQQAAPPAGKPEARRPAAAPPARTAAPEAAKPSGPAGGTSLPRAAEEAPSNRDNKMAAPRVESVPAPAAPARSLFRSVPEAGGTGAQKEEAAQDLLQSEKARPQAKTEAGGKGSLTQTLKKIVTERYADGRTKVEVTYRTASSGAVKVMEERFDSAGMRDGLQRSYDKQERMTAEVLYRHGEVVSAREFNPDGTLKTGEPKRDWPWLKTR